VVERLQWLIEWGEELGLNSKDIDALRQIYALIEAQRKALEDEREECAKVADDHARKANQELHGHDRMYEARRIATAIRARALKAE
jgi:hypothetical protein